MSHRMIWCLLSLYYWSMAVAEPTFQQQLGGLLSFPEGRGPDGSFYKTDYRCEGENMTISCDDSDGPGAHGIISVVRANFGRFSIAICNKHGQTDWNVNCMAPQTTKILQQRCNDLQNCIVPVDSNVFHDACPGTFKYLEVHYACRSLQQHQPPNTTNQTTKRGPPLPPWLFDGSHNPGIGVTSSQATTAGNQRRPWANRDHQQDLSSGLNSVTGRTVGPINKTSKDQINSNESNELQVQLKKDEKRKPFLVTETLDSSVTPTTSSSTTPFPSTARRVPITTPRPTVKVPSAKVVSGLTGKNESTTPKPQDNGGSISYGNFSRVKSEIETDVSSPPVSTFTMSSSHDADKMTLSTVEPASEPEHSAGVPSITTSCPPATSRKLQWDWTQVGEMSIQPCPIGATGLAKWNCIDAGAGPLQVSGSDDSQNVQPQWFGTQPDMSDCKSVAMSNLEAQVRKEDPENVLISSLSYVTRTKALYGGDLESAVAIMRTVASRVQYRLQSTSLVFHNKESHIRQVLQNVLQSASNILEKSNRRAWIDLRPERRMKVATSLLLALEESAFLLAGVLNQPTHILETYEILTLAIAAIETDSQHESLVDGDSYSESEVAADQKVTFPSKRLLYVDDAIELVRKDVEVFGQEGVAEAVFFSYSTLHEILGAGKFNFESRSNAGFDWKLNSRIVSASLGQGRHVQLNHAAKIYLRHLVAENMTDPVCVYWDYEVHSWSDDGCRLVSSNASMTQCECNHLTNFAVVMRPINATSAEGILTSIRIDIVVYVVSAVVLAAIIVILIKFRKRISQWCRCTPSFGHSGCLWCCQKDKQSHLEKGQTFYTGLSRSSHGNLVMGPNGLQCSTPNTSKTRFFTGPNRTHSQYVLANHQLFPPGGHCATMAPSTTSTSLLTQPLMSAHNQGKGTRAHITLNPYSTQLVESINLMMPEKSSASSSATNSSSSTTSTTLGRPNHKQTCSMNINPHLVNLTNSLRRGSTPMGLSVDSNHASVINIDPMMASQSDMVYRAVSPHGHVYWEIDPSQAYGTNNNGKSQGINEENIALLVHHAPVVSPVGYQTQYADEEEQSLLLHNHSHNAQLRHHQHHPVGNELRPLLFHNQNGMQFQHCPSLDDLNAEHLQSQQGRIVMTTSSSNNILSQTAGNMFIEPSGNSSFVRKGANRFQRHPNTQHSKRINNDNRHQQQSVSSVSASLMNQPGSSGGIPEQLQTQVQIKDIKPIQVSVKSSEYIEAKIRTLRKNAK